MLKHHRGFWLFIATLISTINLAAATAMAQLRYVARFKFEESVVSLGAPIFCDFIIENTGTVPFVFSYRFPSRKANPGLSGEPHFAITDTSGMRVRDPQPHPCTGAKGRIVYGSAAVPPGGEHTERWLLNQWGEFLEPGVYHVRAERHLPLYSVADGNSPFEGPPSAFALALDQLTLRVIAPRPGTIESRLRPYIRAVQDGRGSEQREALLVLSTLPHEFCLNALAAFAASPQHHGLMREQALDGLARLGTPAAWQRILLVAEGAGSHSDSNSEESVRSHAVLLLGESRNPRFVEPLIRMLPDSPPKLRGNILQTLGYFGDPRASQALIHDLHSSNPLDRMNAVLGVKNLARRGTIPPLLAMLNDPSPQVRAVTDFALEKLTGHQVSFSSPAAVSQEWGKWWLAHATTFKPVPPAPCRDW